MQKMGIACQLTKCIHKKKSISGQAKMSHFRTIFKPGSLYAFEYNFSLKLNGIENLKTEEGKYSVGSKYQTEAANDGKPLRRNKKKLASSYFCGHVLGMDDSEVFTNQIFSHDYKKKKTAINWSKSSKRRCRKSESHTHPERKQRRRRRGYRRI